MTTNTPTYALPYPDPTDPIANGDDTIKALAQRVEAVLSGGDVAPTWLAAAQNIPSGGSANLGSITIPATLRRRHLVLELTGSPGTATQLPLNLVPNYGDPRIADPGVPTRQYTAAATLAQVFYWHFHVAVGAAGTTQFQLNLGAVAFNSARARAWVI